MDRQVLSEKERLAARISELENRLAAVKKAKLKVSHSDNNVQTYGDYVWLPEDATAMTSEDVDFATAEAHYNEMALGNPSGSSFPSFKYVLSPNERRKPKDLQAKSWAEVDGGNRVLTAYKSVFDLRKPGEKVSDSDDRKWTEVVGVNNENELSMFHDWQVKVFEKGNASNNASMTAQELSENISVWVGMEEEILGNANDKSNMDDLMEMVKLGEGKISKDLLSKAKDMLNKMASVHNKIDPNHSKAAMKINKYMGMKGNFLQASLGRVRNQMDNIVGFKDVAFYVGEDEPTVNSKKLSVDDEVVGGNYIRLDRSKYAFNVQPATDEVDEESGFYKEDYEMGRMAGPIVNLNDDELKNKTIWLRYTVVSKLGNDITVSERVACEKPVEKKRALIFENDVEEVEIDGKKVARKAKPQITTRDQVIYDLQQGCSPLKWYRPIATNIDFAHLHFQGRIPAGTDLTGADFTGSNLTGVVFDECILNGANFKGCKIQNTSFAGCSYDVNTIWPLGFGDITPDYFTITPDLENGATNVIANNQPWFPFSEYVHSDGVHDPSGNLDAVNGTWGTEYPGTHVKGAKHWEDLSGVNNTDGNRANHVIYESQLRSMGNVKSTKYIENSSSHRLTKGMADLIYDDNDGIGTQVFKGNLAKNAGDKINVGGKLKSQSMIALFGMPPTFVDTSLTGVESNREYKRGDPGVMQVDVSKCYILNDFFTRDSACSWEANPVSVTPIMTLLGKGNVSNMKIMNGRVIPKKDEELKDLTFQVSFGSDDLRTFSAYTLMYTYRHGLIERAVYSEHYDDDKNDWTNSKQNEMILDGADGVKPLKNTSYNGPKGIGGEKLFTQTIDIYNDEYAQSKLIVFPVQDMQKDMPDLDVPCPGSTGNPYESLASSLPSDIPYNMIFNHIDYELFDQDEVKRANGSLSSSTTADDIVPTTYIRPYTSLDYVNSGNRYGKKVNKAGEMSEKEVKEFLNMAQFPSFGSIYENGSAMMDNSLKRLEETVNGESFRVMNSIYNEKTEQITNRFRNYPIKNMVDANFEGCKFNWFEYNHGNSEHPDSINEPTKKSYDLNESRSFIYATVFANAKLHRANFKKADLKRCVFYNCELYGADFTEADIRGVIFKDCKYVPTPKDIEKDEKLRDVVVNFTKVSGKDEGLKGTNNNDIDNMKEADCVETRGFRNVRFFNDIVDSDGNMKLEDLSCNFTEANLYGAEFIGVEIGGDLSGVNIKAGVFSNVRLVGERVGTKSDNKGVKLHNSDLRYSLIQYKSNNNEDSVLNENDIDLTNFISNGKFDLPDDLVDLDIPDLLDTDQEIKQIEDKESKFSKQKKETAAQFSNMIKKRLFIEVELAKKMMSKFKKMQVSAINKINELKKTKNPSSYSKAIIRTLEVSKDIASSMLLTIKRNLALPLGLNLKNLRTKISQEPSLLDRARAGDKELSNSDWSSYVSQNPIRDIDLENACIDNSTLSGIQFINAKLSGAQLNDCSLNNIQLYDCDMYQTNFSKSWLENADISGGEKEPTNTKNTLMEANFSNADLKDAKFYNVLVSKTDFRSSFSDGKRKESLYKAHSKWDGTWIQDTHFLRLWIHKNEKLEQVGDKINFVGNKLLYKDLQSGNTGKEQCELSRKGGRIELLDETNQGVEAIPDVNNTAQNPNWSFYAPKFPTGFEYAATLDGRKVEIKEKFENASGETRDGPTIFEQMDANYFTELRSAAPEYSLKYLSDVSGVKIENLSDIGSGNPRPMVFTKSKKDIIKKIQGSTTNITRGETSLYRIKEKPQIFWRKKKDVYENDIQVDAEPGVNGTLPQYESLNAVNSIIDNVVFDRLVLPGAKFVGAKGSGRFGSDIYSTEGTSFVNIQSWYRREIKDEDGKINWEKMGILGQIPYNTEYFDGSMVDDGVKNYLKQNGPVVISNNTSKNLTYKRLSTKEFEENDEKEEELLKAVRIDFSGAVLSGGSQGGDKSNTDISRVYFNGAYIPYSNFTNAKLQMAVFGASNKKGNIIESVNTLFKQNDRPDIKDGKYRFISNLCVLTGSTFKNADLSGANFYRAVIDKCDFTDNKSLRKVIVNGATTNEGLSFKSLESAKGIVLNGADLSGCVIGTGKDDNTKLDMTDCQLVKTNLVGATFNSVKFNNAKFGFKEHPMSLENTTFFDFDTKTADFKYSMFKNTRFVGIDNNKYIQNYTEDKSKFVLGTNWPVGYYREVNDKWTDKKTIFNFPSTLRSEGFTYKSGQRGGSPEYLQPPKAISMLKYGVVRIQEALLDTNIINYNPDNETQKMLDGLQVDYQAPNHYAFYKKDDVMADGSKAKGGEPKFSIVYVNKKGEMTTKVQNYVPRKTLDLLLSNQWIEQGQYDFAKQLELNEIQKSDSALSQLALLDKKAAETQITTNKGNSADAKPFRTYMLWIENEWLYQENMRLLPKEKQLPYIKDHWADLNENGEEIHQMGGMVEMEKNKKTAKWEPKLEMMHRKPLVMYKKFENETKNETFKTILNNALDFKVENGKVNFENWENQQKEIAELTASSEIFNKSLKLHELIVEPILINSKNSLAKDSSIQNSFIYGVDFTGSDFTSTTFVNNHFYKCLFDKCVMKNVKIDQCYFECCSFVNTDFSELAIENGNSDILMTSLVNCDFYGSNFKLALLQNVSTSGCSFDMANFELAYLDSVAVCKVPKLGEKFYEKKNKVDFYSDIDSLFNELNNQQLILEQSVYDPKNIDNFEKAENHFKNVITNNFLLLGANVVNEKIDKLWQGGNKWKTYSAKNPPIPDNNLQNSEALSDIETYWWQLVEKSYWDEQINKMNVELQTKQKNYIWQSASLRLTEIKKKSEYINARVAIKNKMITRRSGQATLSELFDSFPSDAAYHSDFREALFKETMFNNFSLDGNTEDLHGLNPGLLPDGFLNKLWNNKLNSAGDSESSDASGNIQIAFERSSQWFENDGENNSSYMLGGVKTLLPAIESEWGIWELSHNFVLVDTKQPDGEKEKLGTWFVEDQSLEINKKKIYDPVEAKKYGITLQTIWKKITDPDEIKKGPLETGAIKQYHKPLEQGWYPLKANSTVLNTDSGYSAAGKEEELATDYHNNIYSVSSTGNSYGDLKTEFLKKDQKSASKIAIKYARNTSATAGVVGGVDLNTNNGYNHLLVGYIRTNNTGFDKGTDLSGNGASRIDGPSFRDRLLAHSRAYTEGRVSRGITIAGVSRDSKNISRLGLDGGSTLGDRLQMQGLILSQSDFSSSGNYLDNLPDGISYGGELTNVEAIKYFTKVKNPEEYKKYVNKDKSWSETDSASLYEPGFESGLQLIFADLTGSNFSGCDLTNANFEGAILRDVNFDSANLTGVNLKGADLTGATFIKTNMLNVMVGFSELSHSHTVFKNSGLSSDSDDTPENAISNRYKNKEALFWKITKGDGNLGDQGQKSRISLWSNETSYWPYGMSISQVIGSSIKGTIVGRTQAENNETARTISRVDEGDLFYDSHSVVPSYKTHPDNKNIIYELLSNITSPAHIDLLKSGRPLLGGLNFSKSLIPDRGTNTANYDSTVDISYTELDTTNSLFFTTLSKVAAGTNSTSTGLSYGNGLNTIDLTDENDKISILNKIVNFNTPTSYDTIFDTNYDKQVKDWNNSVDSSAFSYANKSDLRHFYIDHFKIINKKKDLKARSHLVLFNFPPNAKVMLNGQNKGGEMLTFEKIVQMAELSNVGLDELYDPEKYPVLQPRYDFSTPNKLKEGETKTIFDGCDLSHCLLPYSNFINVSAVNAKFNAGLLRGCDFTNADLEGADFSYISGKSRSGERTDLVKTKFVNANLKNANFMFANLAYCDFSGANIQGCQFYGANIANADFRHANFGTGANFVGAGPWYDVGPDNDSTVYNGSILNENLGKIGFQPIYDKSNQLETNYKIGEYWTLNHQEIYEEEFNYKKLHEKQNLSVSTKEMDKWKHFNKNADGKEMGSLFNQSTSVGSKRRDGFYRFSFTDEALSQDKTALYHQYGKKLIEKGDSVSERIKAHKDFLLNVLPKFPKGFNTMAALGWERDASGIIIPHFRRGWLFAGAARNNDSLVAPRAAVKDSDLINNLLIGKDIRGDAYPKAADAGYEDYRVMGVFGGKQQGDEVNRPHYYDPMARYTAQDYDPAVNNAEVSSVSSFEHGHGMNNAPRDAYYKLQTQLSCTKFEALNEPIQNGVGEDLSGLVFNVNQNSATTATFKNCNFLEGYPNGMRFKHCDLSSVSFENVLFPNSNDGEKRLEFHDCSMNATNFNNAKLQNSFFKDDVRLKGATFHGADLTGASFKGVDLEGVEFTNVSVFANIDTEHRDAIITNVDFEGCKNPHLAKWPLGTDISAIVGLGGEAVNRGDPITVYEMIKLGRKNFNKITFTKNSLEEHYGNGQEPKVDFSGCQMHDCVFKVGVDLNGVDFSGADLQDCDFRGVNLKGAIFTDYTRFKRTKFAGATKGDEASWPTGFIYPLAVADKNESNDLVKYYLGRNSTIENEIQTSGIYRPVSLWYDNSMNDISSALIGPLADKYPEDMNVKGTFSYHDISSNNPTIFEQAIGFPPHQTVDYDGRSQSTQISEQMVAEKTQQWPNIVNNQNNKVIAPTVDNSGIFVGQNLQHLDFSRETFHNGGTIVYDFSGAKIRGSQFIYADLSGVDFKNCVYRDNNGVKRADVQGCDFTGANLTNADFSGCDIRNCSFVYATINNTNFKHTKNSDSATFPDGFDFIWDHRDSADYWTGGAQGNPVPNSTYDYTKKEIAIREILGAFTGYHGSSKNVSEGTRLIIKDRIKDKYSGIPVSDGNGGQAYLTNTSDQSSDGTMRSNWVASRRITQAKNNPYKTSGGLGKSRVIKSGIAIGTKYDFTMNMWKNQEVGNNGSFNTLNISQFVDLSNNVDENGDLVNELGEKIDNHNLFKGGCLAEGNLNRVSFRNVNLEQADFSGADLSGVDLSGAVLFDPNWELTKTNVRKNFYPDDGDNKGINFRNASLFNPALVNVAIDTALFNNIKRLGYERTKGWERFYLNNNGPVVKLKAVGSADFTNVKFYYGDMGSSSIDLTEVYAPHSKFTNADLSGVDFSGADLTGCDFRGANLTRANFEFATLHDADFRGALLKETVATNAVWNDNTKMPDGFEPSQVELRINKDYKNIEMWTGTKEGKTTYDIMSDIANNNYSHRHNLTTVPATLEFSVKESVKRLISGASADKNITKRELKLTGELDVAETLGHWNNGYNGWQLQSANQSSTSSHIGDDLSGTNFQDTAVFGEKTKKIGGCTETILDLSKADLSGANLMEVDLRFANLYDANLSKVDLSGTDFYNADMTKAKLHEVDSRRNTGSKANTTDGKPIPSEYLWPKCMEEVDISASDFSGVVFTVSTDMSGAVIVDSSFNNVIADKIKFDYAKIGSTSENALHKTTFEKACFTGVCSFEHADISNVDLSGAQMAGHNYDYAKLENLNFVDINHASLGQASFNHATIKNCDLSGTASRKFTWDGHAQHATFIDLSFTHVDLNNCDNVDLSSASFHNVQFTTCDLKTANFNGVDLSNVSLVGNELEGIHLKNANISNSNLSGTNLGAADLSGTNLVGTNLNNVNMSLVNTTYAENDGMKQNKKSSKLQVPYLLGNDLSGSSLTNIAFGEFIFKDCNLTNVDFNGSDLSNVQFINCNMTHNYTSDASANLQGAINTALSQYGKGMSFKNSTLWPKTFQTVNDISSVVINGISSVSLDLSNTILSLSRDDAAHKLHDAQLPALDLSGSTMRHANIKDCILNRVILTGTDLSNATISNSILIEGSIDHTTDLHNAKLTNIDLSGASLVGADISSAKLENVNLFASDLAGTKIKLSSTVLSVLSFGRANLGSDSVALDLSGANLQGVSFVDASLNNVDFTNADLSGVDFRQLNEVGSNNTDLAARSQMIKDALHSVVGAKLDHVKLTDLSLVDIDLSGVHGGVLNNIDFSNCNLTGAIFKGLQITDCNFTDASLNSASFQECTFTGKNVFDRTDISGMDVSGANLLNVKLSGAGYYYQQMDASLNNPFSNPKGQPVIYPDTSLSAVGIDHIVNLNKAANLNGLSLAGFTFTEKELDLSGADLSGINMSNVVANGLLNKIIDFSGCNLKNSNFSNCDFSGVKFHYANLENVKFNNASLKNCDFSGANVKGADFTEADLSGSIFLNTNISQTTFYKVQRAPDVSGVDLHRVYTSVDGSIPDEDVVRDKYPVNSHLSVSFRKANVGVIKDASGNNFAVNSVGLTGYDGVPEKNINPLNTTLYPQFKY